MKFLVAYDGSDASKSALDLATIQAKRLGAEVVVLSSSEGGTSEKPEKINQIKEELNGALADVTARGVPCTVKQLARGLSAGEDLVLYAEENQVDQLFVGIRKKSKTMKMFLGSTAQYIILKAGCPVTTTK